MKRIPILSSFSLAVLIAAGPVVAQDRNGAVINKAGVAVKLITTRPGKLYEKPDASSLGSPVGPFQFWYVLPPDSNATSRGIGDLESITRDGFYRVAAGPNEATFKGWMHQDDIIEWHHRQAVRFAPRQGRELAHFFREKDEAVQFATDGAAEAATHREPEEAGGALVVMPLLGRQGIQVDDQEMEMFEVAFMAQRPASAADVTVPPLGGDDETLAEDLTREAALQSSTLDIVFVIDTTASMEDPIDQVRRSVVKVAKDLAGAEEMKSRLRFGLVAYRDIVKNMGPTGMEYLARVVCDLEEGANHHKFLDEVASLDCANISSGDYPEDVLAGVAKAMEQSAVKWNPLAWKLIVVVGDSSVKGPDHDVPECRNNEAQRSIASVMAQAQPGTGSLKEKMSSNFVINAVHVQDEHAAEDHPVAERQYNTLTKGRGYQGKLIKAQGGSDAEDFSEPLTELIRQQMGSYTGAILKGGGRAAAPRNATAADFPFPLLDLLEQIPEGESDAEKISFGHRFCTERDAEGNLLFVPHVFVRKGQLRSFSSMLEFLQGALEDAGEPGSRDVEKVVDSMKMITATLNLAEPITKDMEIEQLLMAILGFPLKTEIFRISLETLSAMTQTDYDDWVKGVKVCNDTIRTLIENPNIWIELAPGVKDREKHAFIALADLP